MEQLKEKTQDRLSSRRTLERTPYHLVERPTDVMFIGDLNGKLLAFHKNCEYAGLLDQDHNWIGGNKILILTGDIIGDRCTEGFDILLEVGRLRLEAQKLGGDIILIAGNHDELVFSFLRDSPSPNTKQIFDDDISMPENSIDPLSICALHQMGIGITELVRYLPEQKKIEELVDPFSQLEKNPRTNRPLFEFHKKGRYRNEEILANMRRDPQGKKILEVMCTYNLLFQIDDNLAHHCPMSEQISDLIEIYGIDFLNNLFKAKLRKDLLGENVKFTKIQNKIFEESRMAFLSTNNRNYLYDENVDFSLSLRGINLDIHGHNPEGGKVYQIGSNVYSANIDFGAWYSNEEDGAEALCSLAVVDAKSSQIKLGNPQSPIIVRRDDREITLKIRGITNKVRALISIPGKSVDPEVHESLPKSK